MSTRVYPAVHSTMIRSDSIDLPPDTKVERRGVEHLAREVKVRLFEGASSQGYATNYQRVLTYWVEAEVYGVDRPTIRRECWRVSGKDATERADKMYRGILAELAGRYPGANASFPTGPRALAIA